MPTKKTTPTKKAKPAKKAAPTKKPTKQKVAVLPEANPVEVSNVAAKLFTAAFTSKPVAVNTPIKMGGLEKRMVEHNMHFATTPKKLLASINKIGDAKIPVRSMPEDVRKSLEAMKGGIKRFHGARMALTWFPFPLVGTRCSDKFGYMTNKGLRNASMLPFNPANQVLLGSLGNLMGDTTRPNPDSTIPAGYTYFGQFVDHDITLDISSTLETLTDANTISNMRTPALDLDSLYGRGPGLDAYMYAFPSSGPETAIKFVLGTNTSVGAPGTTALFGTVFEPTNFDTPRMHNPTAPALSTLTAVIGDPRNDENLIVAQFHHAMLKFHNKVVDLLVLSGFSGDIFTEAKKIVTHHYQWAVVNDYLKQRICGAAAVADAITNVNAPVGSTFRMPVEFAVAAYRFGHSLIRNNYWVNFLQINASLAEVFDFIRKPQIPVRADWAVNFNAFFDTGIFVPVNNKAKQIDSVLAAGLEAIPGGSGIMAILATRNLRRGLALGLPSGQAMAAAFGLPVLTTAEILNGLPVDEVTVLNSNGGVLLSKTPLWYYILREAKEKAAGDKLGPLGAKIVADTFIRMLKRDANSYLNVTGGFTPMLPSDAAGDFTVTDLVKFSGVCQP